MKQCPHCRSDIPDNAGFCLYCMRSLDKQEACDAKKQPHPWVVIVMEAAVIFALLTWILMHPNSSMLFTPKSSTAASSTASEITSPPTQTKSTPAKTEPSSTAPRETELPATVSTEPAPTEPAPSLAPEDIFTFRTSAATDYCDPNDMNLLDIVITGVKVQQEVYYIPDSIPDPYGGENRVVGITKGAFEGSGAKVIYTSSCLRFIHYDAFKGCKLTDLYLSSDCVELSPYAYDSLETLHTTAQANTGILFINTLSFSEITSSVYHAKWEEWKP